MTDPNAVLCPSCDSNPCLRGCTERSEPNVLADRSVPMSVTVLRDDGPLDVREVARRTADRLGFGSITYADVYTVLVGAMERGDVRVKKGSDDWRAVIWEAVRAA